MKTQEVERRIGITKQTLYYYENEGLLTVSRDENGYRNYSEENIETLNMIKNLRDLDVSMDDIRLIFKGEVSFQDVLLVKQESLNYNLDKQKDTKEKVDRLQSKNAPLISNVTEIESDTRRYPFSYWKSTSSATLGRKATKGYLWRNFLIFFGPILLISLMWYGINLSVYERDGSFLTLILIIIGAFLLSWILLLGDIFPSGKPILTSRYNFMSFNEDGINYYKSGNIVKNARYTWGVLTGNDASKFGTYDDIERLVVSSKKRYFKPYTPIALDVITLDFHFYFKDGTEMFMLSPMLLGNDSQWVASILLEKVKDLVDNESALERLKNGENLTEVYHNEHKH